MEFLSIASDETNFAVLFVTLFILIVCNITALENIRKKSKRGTYTLRHSAISRIVLSREVRHSFVNTSPMFEKH
uniref:Uncharacterized protein n=1 Tax=Glossina palpalis gambiensis TaxID=67801 RepID=A0A1B0B6G5_9MUSC